MASMFRKISLSGYISITKGYFVTKFFKWSLFYQGLSFGGFVLKIEFVALVYELFIYEKIIFYYLVM